MLGQAEYRATAQRRLVFTDGREDNSGQISTGDLVNAVQPGNTLGNTPRVAPLYQRQF